MIKPDYTIITGANQFSDKYTFTKGTFSVDVKEGLTLPHGLFQKITLLT